MIRLTTRALVLACAVAFPAPILAQANVPETHTVKDGDTLWDLAQLYYNDPLQWPRIYQMNTTVVEDPHWIYPGEILRLSSEEAVTSVPVTPGDTTAQVGDPVVVADPIPDGTPIEEQPSEEPVTAEAITTDTTPIFPRGTRSSTPFTIDASYNDSYVAVSRGEFFQAGWLTEGQDWPLGTLLGTVAPQQVAANGSQVAYIHSQVAIDPPTAGAYQVGDSLLIVTVDGRGFGGFGNAIVPVGMMRVTDATGSRPLGVIIAQYNALHPRSRVIAAEKYTPRPGVRAQPLADGIEGTIIGWRSTDVLHGVGDVGFLDRGKNDGMQVGDVLEAYRTRARESTPVMVPEIVARLQVVHVGERTSTFRITWVAYPDIVTETRWKLVGRLPG
jgi:hypothetical protein